MLRHDGLLPRPGAGRAERACRSLGVASHVLIGVILLLMVTHGENERVLFAALPAVAVLHLLQFPRLVLAARVWPERRRVHVAMLVALVLFHVGATLTGVAGGVGEPVGGLSVGIEVVLLPAYLALTVCLVIDAPGRWRLGLGPLLDAVVLGGAALCAATALLDFRVIDLFPGLTGPRLALPFGYPILGILLITGVLFQTAWGRRAWSSQTPVLIGGFAALAVGSAEILRRMAEDSLEPALHSPFALAVGLALVTSSLCGPLVRPFPEQGGRGALLPAAAALVPLAILTGTQERWVALMCAATLVVVAARFALSLRQAVRMTLTDELTGLPNRRAVLARGAADTARDEPLGLLIADLDGFARINNTLGHAAGDTILRLTAQRLRAGLPREALVARLGADEFAVLAPFATAAAAYREATRIRELVSRPVQVLGHTVSLDASIGLALRAPAGEAEQAGPHLVSDLLRQADIAVYQARTQRSGTASYARDQDDFTPDRLLLAEQLRRAFPGQIAVWYQPQVHATTHELAGLEALVRWNHPERGILAPGHFLDVARQAGLMTTLTEVIADTVLGDVHRLRAAGIAARVSFNVAPAELLDAALLTRLLTAVDQARLPPAALTVEVTEDSLIADPERARSALARIAEHDVEIAIDDYGSGYSSLAYLRDLPVHELKMDRSFVTAVGQDERSRIIVGSTAQLAHGLGLRTVAEGVEDAEAAQRLRGLGVDLLQGYHFARPMPRDELIGWAARREQVPGDVRS